MEAINYKYCNTGEFPVRYVVRKSYNQVSRENLNKGFRTLGVSTATRKKIAKSARVLGICAKKRTVRNSAGKYVPHLLMFITLTLPSEQIHTDAEITAKCLGNFLNRARKIGLLQNYVWRAEKQKNGNIHYHILTDTFANFSMFRRLWYISLRSLGYLQAYQKKFSEMSFEEYRQQPFNQKKDLHKVTAAFAHGKRSKWQEPPACHTVSLTDNEGVTAYVSKYIAKADPDNPNIVTGRTWGASQSVSQSVQSFTQDQEFNKFWYQVGSEMMNRETITHDYFSICLFKFSSLQAWFDDTKKYIKNIFLGLFTPCPYWQNSVGLIPI